jgi:hypothetical protein
VQRGALVGPVAAQWAKDRLCDLSKREDHEKGLEEDQTPLRAMAAFSAGWASGALR